MSNTEYFEDTVPKINDKAWIHPQGLVIGDVHIDEFSSIWPFTVVRGDVHKIRIGKKTNIQDGSVLHVSHDSHYMPGGAALIIGEGVTVGHKVILHGCEIGNYCLIGMGSIVMDNVIVEPEVVLGAGSLVTSGKRLESGYLYRGSPAQKVRKLSDKEIEQLHYSAEHYVRLMHRHHST